MRGSHHEGEKILVLDFSSGYDTTRLGTYLNEGNMGSLFYDEGDISVPFNAEMRSCLLRVVSPQQDF